VTTLAAKANMTRFDGFSGPALLAVLCLGPITFVSATAKSLVRVISSRPDTVSGGDVLVGVRVTPNSNLHVRLNGHDVTRDFRPPENPAGATGERLRSQPGGATGLAATATSREIDGPRELIALLGRLNLGQNKLEVQVKDAPRTRITLINYPPAGPIFSGPHQQPFTCQTVENGLGPPLDADCTAATLVQYYYKSTDPVTADLFDTTPAGSLARGFKPYNTSAPPPPDVAQTLTSDGHTVPYIVRREIGTLNRAVYDIQFLHQPGEPLPTPWTPPTPGWNGRIIYLLDGGCGAGYRQGTFHGAIGAANEPFVAKGYATATSTLNIFGNNCNDRLSAETLSMVKEYFIKHFGAPAYTIGWGESGGAMDQYLIVQNYPGLLDGIIPYMAFPDMLSTAQSVSDCALLGQAFQNSSVPWTQAQKTAVSGFATWRTCSVGWTDGFGHPWPILDPQHNCVPLIRTQARYDGRANPKGVRCDIYTNEINFLQRDSQTGLPQRPLDNVGVQYGLAAFNLGSIDAEHFVELNERVGGYDNDGHIIVTRTTANPEAVYAAYQHGLLLTGGGGLRDIPIIEWRRYSDDLADQHDRFRSFATRARLIAANGIADNQVLLVYPRYTAFDWVRFAIARVWPPIFAEQSHELVQLMDRWLNNIAADTAPGPRAAKVARDKPPELSDGCWTTEGEHIIEHAGYPGSGRCNQIYPPHADPRIAAGGPLADDVLKCVLKPLDPAGYTHPLTPDQLERLRAVFPTGVCDYTQPGIGQHITPTAWQSF